MAALGKKKSRVRVSKNRKRNWNKCCDVKDVEDYLEEKRFEERIGGAVSEKSDAELYFIQTDLKEKNEALANAKEGKKQLRCFQNIGSYSKVAPPHKRNIQPFSKKINNTLTRADEKRFKKSRVNASKQNKKVENDIQTGDMFIAELKDLWAEETAVDPEIEDLVTFRDEYTCKRTPNVPGHRYQKPSLLPSVEIPHSGASYNPDYEEHQELLKEAVVIEAAKQKEELHLKRVLTDMFPTKADAPTQESVLKEMAQGLFDEEDSDEEKEVESPFFTRNPPVSAENRLSKSRKRKRKEMKEQERLKQVQKLQKKNLNEIYRLRSIKSEIKEMNEATQKKIEKHLQRRIEKMYKPKSLSKHKYEAPDLEVQLSEDLSESLRTLKTEGNLLEDRYKSLQRRNLIEPRVPQKRKRKYKLKVQVKRSHRDFK